MLTFKVHVLSLQTRDKIEGGDRPASAEEKLHLLVAAGEAAETWHRSLHMKPGSRQVQRAVTHRRQGHCWDALPARRRWLGCGSAGPLLRATAENTSLRVAGRPGFLEPQPQSSRPDIPPPGLVSLVLAPGPCCGLSADSGVVRDEGSAWGPGVPGTQPHLVCLCLCSCARF